jgi:hypothetical protein
VSPSAPFLQFLGRVLRVMNQQLRAARQLHQPRIDLLAMLYIRAHGKHFPISLNSETIRFARMVVPLSGDYGFHIVYAGEVFAGISDLQELEIGPHVIQLDREIFGLHLDFENLPQIANCLVPAERQERDFLPGIISGSKERKALDMVPVKITICSCSCPMARRSLPRFRSPVPASMMAMRFVSVNVICRQVVLPPNC